MKRSRIIKTFAQEIKATPTKIVQNLLTQRLKKKEKMKQGLFLSVPEAGRIRCVKDWNGYRVKVESLTERPKGERERPDHQINVTHLADLFLMKHWSHEM